jgi:uncharacterized protein DUF3107
VEVRIGVQNAVRELVIDTALTQDQIGEAVTTALTSGSGLLTLDDETGRRIVVPTDKLAYVEIGAPERGHVGFGAL